MAKDASAVAAAPETSKPQPLLPQVEAALTPEQRAQVKRTLWRERCFSLWAPVTVFGALFALYIVIVELYTPSYKALKPLMDAFGLLAVAALIALAVLRYGVSKWGNLRAARHESREALSELDGVFASRVVSEPLRKRAQELALTVEQLYPGTDAEALHKATEALGTFMEKELGRKKYGADFVIGFVKAFAIAMLIRTIVIEPFKIPSGSMIPTLAIGDQIFVNKFIYGVRLPFMNVVPFKIVREPMRGDVIVFNNPVNTDLDFIKRVIAIPGDHVELRDNVLYINGQAQPRKLVNDRFQVMDQDQQSKEWSSEAVQLYEENLSGHEHPTLESPASNCATFNNGEPFTVPDKMVFVMGDNRDNSSDSRFGLGTAFGKCTEKLTFVPYGNIKGKAMVIWLSLSNGGFMSSLFGGTGLRTDRLFLPVR
ncbi:MAG: signal peptidase I [Myxococcaceae bacterium]